MTSNTLFNIGGLQFVEGDVTQDLSSSDARQAATTSIPTDNGRQMFGDNWTIEELISVNQTFDDHKVDYEMRSGGLQLQNNGKFKVNNNEAQVGIEDHALSQMCQRLGSPFFGRMLPRDYVRGLLDHYPSQYAPIINDHAHSYDGGIYLRTYGDDIRAYMSDRYTHIDNTDVLDMLQTFLRDQAGGKYQLVRPYIGRDGCHIRVMLRAIRPQETDSAFGLGAVIRTGETGLVSPQVLPFVQRTACTNSTVWKEGGIKIRQVGNRETKKMMLAAAIGEALQATEQMVHKMVEAQYQQLPSIDTIISGMAEANGWGEEVKLAIAHGTENQQTMAGLVNGLTYAAHVNDLPADRALEMETIGGQFLFAGREHVESRYVPVGERTR